MGKFRMKRQKRGMSPLIATVLLIGFAVALAALVMTWGMDFIQGQTENVDRSTEEGLLCVNQLDFKIEINCADNKVGVDNRGSVDITALRLRKHAATGDVTPMTVGGLLSGEKKWFQELGVLTDVDKVDVVATIKGAKGNDIQCTTALREAVVTCTGP